MPQHDVGSALTETSVIREIEADFPGWSAWHSDTGRWWAFRTAADPLTFEELRAGRRLIVQGDTAGELRIAIRSELAGQ
jgi:hypothetical protein